MVMVPLLLHNAPLHHHLHIHKPLSLPVEVETI
ncbi:hypothetical protein I315_06006 [Cryptococcus gattii Ru294]|nr:hypothetical protein I315_06006 [Cryptococcus gattii Ru294]